MAVARPAGAGMAVARPAGAGRATKGLRVGYLTLQTAPVSAPDTSAAYFASTPSV
jgi:hypothetical protein